MLAGGLALGALYFQVSGGGWTEVPVGWSGTPHARELADAPAPAPAPDPFAESRKSREILRAQEYGPIPRVEPAGPDIGTETVGRGDVVDVIDGDTFRYGSEKIRIADIDTPEVHGRCAEETELAARATRRMAQLLGEGPFKLVPIDRDVDRYGRKLRIVTRGGRSLGDHLVAEGLARTWTGRREPWCA